MTSGEQRLAHPCPWPGCGKAYKRLDHLERHQKSPGTSTTAATCVTGSIRGACVEERVACDGVPPKICSRCRDTTRQCRYRHLEMEAASPTSPRVSLPGSLASGSGLGGSGGFELSPLAPSVGLAALGDASEGAREGELLGLWPDGAWTTDLILSVTQGGFVPPQDDWFAEKDDAVAFPEEGERVRATIPDDQGSLWARVSASATGSSPPSPLRELDAGSAITPAARGMMQTLTQHAHRPLWPAPDATFPSETKLSACMNLYLGHFASWLPILDSPPSSVTDKAPLLLKAVAGIGSVFERDAVGMLLMEMVRRDLLFICEHDARFTYDVGVVQSTLLTAVFGAFSGSPRLEHHAEVARAGLVASARRMGLLSVGARCGNDDEREEAHRRRRLGWCIFLFDALLAALFGAAPLFPLSEIAAPLPAADEGAFPAVLTALLENGTLPPAPDDIALSVLAYALNRICLDAVAARVFGAWNEEGEYALPVPGYNIHPQALLDQLARHSLRFSAPTHLVVSCAAVAYHAHLQFAGPKLLEDIRVASGRTGPVAAEEAQARLAAWMSARPRRTRDVFAHAAMLFTLMGRFVFDTPPEAVWLFDAALCMWAVLELAGLPDGEVISISWTSTPAVEEWVESGVGSLAIQGVALDGRAVLQATADRLGALSWGLAARYRRVLLGLAQGQTERRGSG